jgi:hypothetical protein
MAKRLSRRPLRRILKLQVELGPYSGEGIDSVASKTFNIAKIECERFRRDPVGGSLRRNSRKRSTTASLLN